MPVAQTSIEAHRNGQRTGQYANQRVQISLALRTAGTPMTRRELSQVTKIEPGAVAGRVNEMIKIGYLRQVGRRKCHVTNRLAGEIWFNNNEEGEE